MTQRAFQTLCLAVLALIAVFFVLQQARGFFAPIIAAMLLGIVMTPLSDLWDTLRLPPAIAALISVSLALLLILIMLVLIEPYVSEAIDRAPVIWSEIRGTIDEFRRALRGLEKMTEDVAQAIDTQNASQPANAEPLNIPSVTDALFYAPQFAAQLLIFTGTLYFWLMSQAAVYAWVGKTFSSFGEEDLRFAGRQVARYVLTISVINMCLGIAVAIGMSLIGMASPILWGVLAFALNYIVYLGPTLLIATLGIAGVVSFDGAMSFAPAIIYIVMNGVEAQFVTPTLVGRNLSVNPLLVFLALVFWLWLWGPIGGIIAIPLTIWCIAVIKPVLDQTTA